MDVPESCWVSALRVGANMPNSVGLRLASAYKQSAYV